MKKLLGFLAVIFFSLVGGHAAQDLVADISVTGIENQASVPKSPRIRDIVVFDDLSCIAYTRDSLFRTDDGGLSWSELNLRVVSDRGAFTSVLFKSRQRGLVLIADPTAGTFELARTEDGGATWNRRSIILENAAFFGIDVIETVISGDPGGMLEITARIPTSSNFTGRAVYRSNDGGVTWHFVSRSIDPREETEASAISRKGNWTIETSGECLGHKSGCVQETKLFISDREVTPPQLKDLQNRDRENARKEADASRMFAAPPGGSTRISLNRGFDKCQAGTVAQMQIWWDNSYHFDSNIYFSGRARACPNQPFTGNPAWIDQVSAMGWGLIPTVIGYQSPCSVSSTPHKHSSDPAMAEQQGRGEADIAATDAAAIGLTAGSVLYYDMEQYNVPSPDTQGCRAATIAFLKGWTERIRQLGYQSGVYGSPRNAQEDWVTLPPASRMDAIWMARWDNIPSVWTYGLFPNFPTNIWNNHQRIKQWQGPHLETWGGVTFEIDGDISDGPVAGVPFPRNKVADFDGDGKTDISVFRPSTGQWFISGSLASSFSAHDFGTGSDILTPGDFDGDGKTDLAVFRPAESTWYYRTKGGFTARQFGEAGDVPAPADFDGDGRTDIAVFRPSTGMWYIGFSDSRGSFGAIPFGQNGDRPAAGDYDGDGKADIAVWRPSDGFWYVQGSTAGFYGVSWGIATDVPAPGDYDGDGRMDAAVFRSAEGTWYVFGSTQGIFARQFGQDADLPVTGDYDGDGDYDISVFRPSNSTWYVRLDTGDYTARDFGVAGDKPIPTGYLPR